MAISVRTPLLCDKIANDDENFGKCSGTLRCTLNTNPS